jgi:hypothetical protein
MSTISPSGAVETRTLPWLAFASLALAGLGFSLVGGLSGVVAALVLGAAWYALPAPYAVAGGHLFLVALLPTDPGLLQVAPAEVGLLGILAADAPDAAAPGRFVSVLAGVALLLSGVASFGFRLGGIAMGAVSLAVVALLMGYGLHRYELLRLGLLDVPSSNPDVTAPPRSGSATDANVNSDGESHAETTTDA